MAKVFGINLNVIIKLIILIINKTALHIAAENNNNEIVKLLLEHKNVDLTIKEDILLNFFNQIFLK